MLTGERLEKAIAFVATYGQEFPLTEVGQAFVVASQQANAAKVFFQETRNMARSIAMPLKQVLALVAIARAEAAADARKEAQDTLDQALAIARGVGDAAEQGQMLAAIALASMQLNDTDQHLESVISAANRFATSMTAIAQAAGQLSDPQSAAAVLEKATTAAEKIDSADSRSPALSAIAQAYNQLSDPQSAAAVLEKATTAAEKLDDAYNRSSALSAIAQAYNQLSDPQSAAAVIEKATIAAEKFGSTYYRMDTLSAIAQAASQLSDPQSAAAVLEKATIAAEKIDDASDRSSALSAIAQAYSQLSDPQSAAAVLEKATTAAEKIDDVSDRRLALSAILKVQEGLGTSETLLDNLPSAPAELKNVLDNALTDVQDSSQLSNYSRHQALLKIIQALRQCPDTASAKALLDRALPIAHGLTLPEFRDKVLGAVAVTYGRIAHWKDAFQTLKLCADEEKTESLTQILDLWVGHHNLAPITNGPQPSTTETKTF